jgi:hypothetical protein
MKYVNAGTRHEFIDWLVTKRPLGLALTDTQLAVGDATGASWGTLADNDVTTSIMTTALATSGRRVWSDLASQAAIRLAKRQHIDIDEFTWLLDASTAWNVVHPKDAGRDLRAGRARKSAGAARDAVVTARLIALFQTDVPKPVRDAVLDSCAQDQLWRRRQLLGWRVDVELLDSELRDAAAGREQMRRELGIDLTDTNTPVGKAAIHEWLARADIRIRDAKGSPSLERNLYDVTVIPDTDAARTAWATFRQVRSIASRTSKLGEIKRALVSDRLYSTQSVRHTITGRAALVKPALQNINRDLRPLIIADPGFTLVALDYDQIEPRTVAGLSGCQALAAALSSGDVYTELAKDLWGDAALDLEGHVLYAKRAQAKTLLLGILYGKGRLQLSIDLGVTVDEAAAFLTGVWEAYPRLSEYNAELQRDMANGISALTATGRRVPKPPRGQHATLNNRTQAEASDIYTQGVMRVLAVLGTEAAFLGVHDELVVSVPTNRVEWAKRVLNELMPTVFRGIPIGGAADELGRAWHVH